MACFRLKRPHGLRPISALSVAAAAGAPFLSSGARAHDAWACDTDEAVSLCLEPRDEYRKPEPNNGLTRYQAASVRYFLTMKSDQAADTPIATGSDLTVDDFRRPLSRNEWNPVNRWFSSSTVHPHYSPQVVRFEFPPWLLTTGYGAVTMRQTDEFLRLYATDYKAIDCRFFPQQPFGRCRVVFLYGQDDRATPEDERTECPIYEEFTFNDEGEVTFIEAWTDHQGYLPMGPDDPWAEGSNVKRLSTYVPGLGRPDGHIEPDSAAMRKAALAYDTAFEAPYWSDEHHRVGPFTSMVEDITGSIGRTQVPYGDWLSFWPNWMLRALAHIDGDVLAGCLPPDQQHVNSSR